MKNLTLLLFFVSQVSFAATYKIDRAHSKVGFEISHLVVATVEGRFNEFDGSFDYDSDKKTVSNTKVSVTSASIDTNEAKRDKHLKSPDFFDVKKYPKITFDNVKVSFRSGKPSSMTGDLTIHGMKKSVEFDVDWKGEVTDPWGNKKVVFNADTTIDRKDFGLTWNKNLDKGGVMIGNEVKIILRIEANQQ